MFNMFLLFQALVDSSHFWSKINSITFSIANNDINKNKKKTETLKNMKDLLPYASFCKGIFIFFKYQHSIASFFKNKNIALLTRVKYKNPNKHLFGIE